MTSVAVKPEFIETLSTDLASENERNFFKRVWQTNPDIYKKRLKALGFEGMENTLDAGSGFGQWSLPLAELNKRVTGLEFKPERVGICQKIANQYQPGGLRFVKGSVEDTGLADNSLDGIFSYSVIYLTDYRITLREFHRILKPGGLLYFSTNGLGWYIYNLLDRHNDAADFSSRDMALQTLSHSLTYFSTGKQVAGQSIVMDSSIVRDELTAIGFDIIEIGPEGSINKHIHESPSFYDSVKYNNENVWEALCRKKS